VWALAKRVPWFHLFFDAIRGFLPPALPGIRKLHKKIPWLDSSLVARHRPAIAGYPSTLSVFGGLPSFQQNIAALDGLRRQVACYALTSEPRYEARYPFLDRTLLEFLYAVPREQLVRPGQRRSLMRRALAGIVPHELLNRKRKAFLSCSHMAAISSNSPGLLEMSQNMMSSLVRVVEPNAFRLAIQRVRKGEEIHIVAMLRTLEIEAWLRHLNQLALLHLPQSGDSGFALLKCASSASEKRSWNCALLVEPDVQLNPNEKGGDKNEIREA
jgi:hypothetical protein